MLGLAVSIQSEGLFTPNERRTENQDAGMLKKARRLLRRMSGPALAPASLVDTRPVPTRADWAPFLKAREGELPDWEAVIGANPAAWRRAVESARGPRVLMASYVGGHPQMTVLESALSVALTLRGARVVNLLCDGTLPGCLRAKISALSPANMEHYELPEIVCRGCHLRGEAVFAPLAVGMARLSEYLTPEDRAEAREVAAALPHARIPTYELNGWPLGEHAMAGTLRYFGRGDLDTEPKGEVVARRYLEASILSARSLERLLDTLDIDVAVMNHGIYVPHGIAGAVCRSAGTRVVTWNLAYRKQCAIFSHDDTYHHTMMSEPPSVWEDMEWGPEQESAILSYLDSRRNGARDWIWFNNSPDDDMARFARETGLDWSKPVVGMLTNVVWDAQLHYPANAFPNMIDWAMRTIAYFANRPDLQLLIRVHPGELAPTGGSTKSRQPMVEEIQRHFPQLPSNVYVIPPESPVSTYSTMGACDAVIIYGTKTGVELTSQGVPVIVAGEAWIRNKGLTLDARTAEEYFAHLDRLPLGKRLDDAAQARARRYAYHFFFRRMVPLPFLGPVQAWPPFVLDLKSVDELRPGVHPGLDVICDGILEGKPFIYPAERLGVHDS